MPLTNLQALVLKDLIVDAIKSRSSDMTVIDDFRALSDDLMRDFSAPRRSLIKAAMLVCDKAEALFDKTALTREAQAQDTAKAAKAEQDAAQKKTLLAKCITTARAQIAEEEDSRRRGHGMAIDLNLTRQRLVEAEKEYSSLYGPTALQKLA